MRGILWVKDGEKCSRSQESCLTGPMREAGLLEPIEWLD